MKRILAIFTAALLCVSLFACFGACTTATDPWAEFSKETLDNEVRVNVRGGKAYLRWSKADDAEKYLVYYSDTTYGDYEAVLSVSDGSTKCALDGTVYGFFKIMSVKDGKETQIGQTVSPFTSTLVVGERDDMQSVQKQIDDTHDRLFSSGNGQFSSERFAVMVMPGTYADLDVKVGYYTSVMGLGKIPTDVTIGSLYVSDSVMSAQNATCTFWRGVENLTINSDTVWAVSQATSMRRVQVNGNLAFSYDGWSSGGFLANSVVTGNVNAGTQQQWMSRNDEWKSWSNVNGPHNAVFSGCLNAPASAWNDRNGRNTNLETTAVIAEKPFLFCEEGVYKVFVPYAEKATSGVTWKNGLENEKGYVLALDDFYIANPDTDNADTINAALASGKHLLFVPGHYKIDSPIKVTKANTVVMGMGYATLEITDENADTAIKVADVDGVRIANLLVDAGFKSASMMEIGASKTTVSHAENPIVLSDIFLRIGGVEDKHTETTNAMIINTNDTIGDNFWLWRADHSRGVAWNDSSWTDENGNERHSYGNPSDTGLLVNGDNVTCYALMVEHFEKYQTYWKGENGMTVMYQSETPYSVPTQEEWSSHDGAKKGYASYKVDDSVQTHTAYGLGIYLVNYGDAQLDSAIEAPVTVGMYFEHLVTTSFLTNGGSINHVINDIGGAVPAVGQRSLVESFIPTEE